MKLAGLSLIGSARAQATEKTFCAVNPATGDSLPEKFHRASAQDVERAAQLAAQAFSTCSKWKAARRAEFIRRIAELLNASSAPIIERTNAETALPPARLQGELARTCFQLRFYSEAAAAGLGLNLRIDHADPQRQPQPKPDLRSMMRPLGPVAVFGASNFPLAYSVAGGDTGSALSAGCPVIVKAHPAHPGTSEIVGTLIQQAARECEAPEGIFSLLFDDGFEIGAALVKHPLIKAVGFTGSRRGGRVLMDIAAARPEPIPVYAEMGSINPVFMLGGVLNQKPEELAAALHGSVTLGVGQFCTNPGLVFVESGVGSKTFLEKLGNLMAATSPGTMLTAGICSAFHSGVEKFSKITGLRCAAKAGSNADKTQAAAVLFVTDAATFLNHHTLMDEIFGPSTLVVECSSGDQMRMVATKLEGQLTATVHGTPEDFASHRDLLELLETKAGRLICNGFPTGVEVCHAMVHGGPYPATSDGRSTSVGTRAAERFLRPVCYQNFPDMFLPDELKESNPLGLWRLVDEKFGRH
jgi:2,5-dioxopentanoate dehydrogenase